MKRASSGVMRSYETEADKEGTRCRCGKSGVSFHVHGLYEGRCGSVGLVKIDAAAATAVASGGNSVLLRGDAGMRG